MSRLTDYLADYLKKVDRVYLCMYYVCIMCVYVFVGGLGGGGGGGGGGLKKKTPRTKIKYDLRCPFLVKEVCLELGN